MGGIGRGIGGGRRRGGECQLKEPTVERRERPIEVGGVREGRGVFFSLEFFGVSGLKVGKAGVKNKKVVL